MRYIKISHITLLADQVFCSFFLGIDPFNFTKMFVLAGVNIAVRLAASISTNLNASSTVRISSLFDATAATRQ